MLLQTFGTQMKIFLMKSEPIPYKAIVSLHKIWTKPQIWIVFTNCFSQLSDFIKRIFICVLKMVEYLVFGTT